MRAQLQVPQEVKSTVWLFARALGYLAVIVATGIILISLTREARGDDFDVAKFVSEHEVVLQATPCVIAKEPHTCVGLKGDEKADLYVVIFSKPLRKGWNEFTEEDILLIAGVGKESGDYRIIYRRRDNRCVGQCA